MNIENKTRLSLEFHDELNQVKIFAVTNHRALIFMGVVTGKEQLVDLFDELDIDHVAMGGDPHPLLNPPSLPTADELSPQKIVEDIEERFRIAHERPLRMLRGEQLTEETTPLLSLRVFSSSTTTDQGLERVKNWFATRV